MKLYHGTGRFNLQSFVNEGVKLWPRAGFKRRSFCCSLSFREATYFALRKTPISDMTQTGVVLEFDAEGMVEGEDYIPYQDRQALSMGRDEQEIVVFSAAKLELVAYHDYQDGRWARIPLLESC